MQGGHREDAERTGGCGEDGRIWEDWMMREDTGRTREGGCGEDKGRTRGGCEKDSNRQKAELGHHQRIAIFLGT